MCPVVAALAFFSGAALHSALAVYFISSPAPKESHVPPPAGEPAGHPDRCAAPARPSLKTTQAVAPEKKDWILYTPPDGSFSVELPWEPICVEDAREAADVLTGALYFTFEVPSATGAHVSYMIAAADVPDVWRKRKSADAVMLAFLGLAEQASERVTGKTRVTVGGLPGYDYQTAKPGRNSRERIVGAGARVYILSYNTDRRAEVFTPEGDRFIDSFRVTSK